MLPTSKLMLLRIHDTKPLLVTKVTDGVAELLQNQYATLTPLGLLIITEKGKIWVEERRKMLNASQEAEDHPD